MELHHLSDEQLHEDTVGLARTEREITATILHHLREVESRRLFSKLKLDSLFAYAVTFMGYSAPQANDRISAMRLLRELPMIEEKIESGALNLTNLVKARTVFRHEKKAQRERTREQKLELLECIEHASTADAVKILEQHAFVELPKKKSELSFEHFDPNVQAKLKRLLDVRAHVDPGMTLHDLIDQLSEVGLDKWDPVRKAERAIKRGEVEPKSFVGQFLNRHSDEEPVPVPEQVNVRTRYIAAATNHRLFENHRGHCSNCGTGRAIQRDHIIAFAQGGSSEFENLQLLCRNCNQRKAIENFGIRKLSRYLREPTCPYVDSSKASKIAS